jgi:hypothetical protein
MTRIFKFALPLAALLLASSMATPARAQFGGGGDGMAQMEQMAPMLNMMKRHMGKKRFAQLMQTVGPMFAGDGGGGGFGGGGFGGGGFDMGGFGGGGFGGGGFHMGSMMGMMGSMDMGAMMGMFSGGSGKSGRRSGKRRYSSSRW